MSHKEVRTQQNSLENCQPQLDFDMIINEKERLIQYLEKQQEILKHKLQFYQFEYHQTILEHHEKQMEQFDIQNKKQPSIMLVQKQIDEEY